MNALKLGQYAAPENHYQVMRALGEDPEEFDFLLQQLMTTYGPGDALWNKQIDDLAQLYWRRSRLERVRTAVVQLALHKLEERQQRRRQEIEESTFSPAQREVLEFSLPEPSHPDARLRMIISVLEIIRQQAQTWTVEACGAATGAATPAEGPHPEDRSALPSRACSILESLYQNRMGWRAARICSLLRLFSGGETAASARAPAPQSAPLAATEPRPAEAEKPEAAPSAGQAGGPQHRELLRLLDEEIAAVKEQFARAEKNNAERAALERDACQAPVGDTWDMMLRQETALDRAIDRKVRLLLALRKEHSIYRLAVSGPPPELDEAAMEELDELLDINTPLRHSRKQTLAEISKLQERSGNVIENTKQRRLVPTDPSERSHTPKDPSPISPPLASPQGKREKA
jgi:hypothetical protein